MKLQTFAFAFLAVCAVVGLATLATHKPGSLPSVVVPTVAGPPTTWPDYSVNGPGFAAPNAPDGALVAYGHKLVTETFAVIGPDVADSALRFAGNNLACQNCHLDGGTNRRGLPLVGVPRTYPQFSKRAGHTITLSDRINECMTRSMNGRALPPDSREMKAFLAYLQFMAEPAAVHAAAAPAAALPPDVTRGAKVFATTCAVCHQADGQGVRIGAASEARGYQFPPLWGPDSFNDGAGMDRFDRAVAFVQHNMPRGVDPAHPQLGLQDAWDVVAFVQAQPRPRFQLKP